MTVTFTLSSLYTGATYVAGPFNIFAVTNTGASTQVGTGITKAQLATGYTISGISDATTGGTVNSTGTCTNSYPWYVAPAPTPTATASSLARIYWTLAAGSASGIIVESASGGTLLNENASGTLRSGYIDVSPSDLPYTVIGRWNSGSGNVVRYNICDDYGSEIFQSQAITNMNMEESHQVFPTPNVVYVNVIKNKTKNIENGTTNYR
jgi:hypothetical protein